MRDAVSLLDQLASTGGGVTLELTQQVLGTAAGQSVYELIDAILAMIPAGALLSSTRPWITAATRASSRARRWTCCAPC